MKNKIKEALKNAIDKLGGFANPQLQPVPVPVRSRRF